jgi:hypothetical protein
MTQRNQDQQQQQQQKRRTVWDVQPLSQDPQQPSSSSSSAAAAAAAAAAVVAAREVDEVSSPTGAGTSGTVNHGSSSTIHMVTPYDEKEVRKRHSSHHHHHHHNAGCGHHHHHHHHLHSGSHSKSALDGLPVITPAQMQDALQDSCAALERFSSGVQSWRERVEAGELKELGEGQQQRQQGWKGLMGAQGKGWSSFLGAPHFKVSDGDGI